MWNWQLSVWCCMVHYCKQSSTAVSLCHFLAAATNTCSKYCRYRERRPNMTWQAARKYLKKLKFKISQRICRMEVSLWRGGCLCLGPGIFSVSPDWQNLTDPGRAGGREVWAGEINLRNKAWKMKREWWGPGLIINTGSLPDNANTLIIDVSIQFMQKRCQENEFFLNVHIPSWCESDKNIHSDKDIFIGIRIWAAARMLSR